MPVSLNIAGQVFPAQKLKTDTQFIAVGQVSLSSGNPGSFKIDPLSENSVNGLIVDGQNKRPGTFNELKQSANLIAQNKLSDSP